MKINQYLLFILILSMSCHTPAIKPAPAPLKAVDTTKVISHPDPQPENGQVSTSPPPVSIITPIDSSDYYFFSNRIRRLRTTPRPRSPTPVRDSSRKGRRTGTVHTVAASVAWVC